MLIDKQAVCIDDPALYSTKVSMRPGRGTVDQKQVSGEYTLQHAAVYLLYAYL